ncbi:hypothetical protein F4561_004284 [Lipingzhangella halophila]|uniref:Uncharacterized protein n=1 Tax=Lipingzhangella halophila TaxID=1783352 RepID=A0A7W7W538_9ACTN|nr:DUF6882 domain-containing protein [Lipingzhangella halophila]MBB4933464.1 hypothetical protein [Lipingzhangella halophila]
MTESTEARREWFSPALERLGAAHAAVAVEQTGVYNEFHPIADWNVDVEASTFRQGDITVQMVPMGTLGTDGSWVWAWANPHMHPPGSARLGASLWLRDLGEREDIPELVTPRLELSEFADARMASERLLIACLGALRAKGYGSVTVDTGARFAMVMTDSGIPDAEFDRITLPRMIMQGVQVFPHDHRATVLGYLERHGFQVTDPFGDVIAAGRDGCSLKVALDEHSRVTNVSVDGSQV